MVFNYPDWFKIEKDTYRIISCLSSAKELSFYLRSADTYIRRLAIIRIGQLRLTESVSSLAEILENHDEDQFNRELCAWVIKAISASRNVDVFVNNKLLSRFTGLETIQDIIGNIEISNSEPLPDLSFFLPSSSEALITEDASGLNNDFIVEDTFSWSKWFSTSIMAAKLRFLNVFRLMMLSPWKTFTGILSLLVLIPKTIVSWAINILFSGNFHDKKVLAYENPPTLKKKTLPIILAPFRLAISHKVASSLCIILLFMLAVNIPLISRSIEQRTNIRTSQVNQFIYSISGEFLAMVSEGAADLMEEKDQLPEEIEALPGPSSPKAAINFFVTARTGLVLRSEPDRTSFRAGSPLTYETTVEYLNISEKDSLGRLWYKIRTPDGRTGWASSRWLEERRK